MSMITGMSPSTAVGMFVAMAGASFFALSKLSTIFSSRKEIHPELKQILRGMGCLGCCSSKMAVGLTGWINEATEGENRIEAANRILNCYGAQLQKKTDETATILDLTELGLTTLPAEIGGLTRLILLELQNNQLTTVPTEIGRLTSLIWLHLNNNQLTTLPAEIVLLTSLEELYLDYNQLTTLPSETESLTSLTCLDLDNNQLTRLPAEIGMLTSLEGLDLDNNQLTTVPPEIGLLTRLISLNINSNQLTILPAEIGLLTRLTELNLNNNQLSSLPADLTNLAQLEGWGEEDCNCSYNYLTEAERVNLPAHMSALENRLGAQKVAKDLQKDLEKNREQIASMTKKILSCENDIKTKCDEIMDLISSSGTDNFNPFPMDVIHKMITEFMDRDDMKRMRVTAKEMIEIGPMVEEVVIQKAMFKDHKRVIENLEESRVHLEGIATERGWPLSEPETEKDT